MGQIAALTEASEMELMLPRAGTGSCSFSRLCLRQLSVSEGGTSLNYFFSFCLQATYFHTLPKESEVTQCGRWKEMLLGKRLEIK